MFWIYALYLIIGCIISFFLSACFRIKEIDSEVKALKEFSFTKKQILTISAFWPLALVFAWLAFPVVVFHHFGIQFGEYAHKRTKENEDTE